jgi:hypothetical protein
LPNRDFGFGNSSISFSIGRLQLLPLQPRAVPVVTIRDYASLAYAQKMRNTPIIETEAKMTNLILTPADLGTIAVALDDARSQGLGDDSTVDFVAAALIGECGFSEIEANQIAYRAIHA